MTQSWLFGALGGLVSCLFPVVTKCFNDEKMSLPNYNVMGVLLVFTFYPFLGAILALALEASTFQNAFYTGVTSQMIIASWMKEKNDPNKKPIQLSDQKYQ